MPEIPVRTYEGLFLLSQNAASDLNAALEFMKSVFTRAEAEVLVLRKWDERKLAFTIKGQKRGTYLLAIFKARATQVANIRRDCDLSEQIIRNMVISGEHLGNVEIELAQRDEPAPAPDTRPRGDERGPREGVPATVAANVADADLEVEGVVDAPDAADAPDAPGKD